MLRAIAYLLLLCVCISSCSDEAVRNAPAKHIIELVAFGFAENPTEENKGFGTFYYCYLNLKNDSVFIQRKINPIEQPETRAWTGTITGLLKDPRILAFIQATNQYENGETISPPVEEGALYCGLTYFTRYKNNEEERFHYYTTHELDKRFEQATRYILSLQFNNHLKSITSFVNEDSIIVPIVNQASFDFRPPPPPDLPPPPPPMIKQVD